MARNNLRISRWYAANFDPARMLLHSVHVRRVADVSKVGSTFIMKIEVK
jgi:hypothetical protein